jgi:phage baseplate assembly protein W
MAFNVRQINPLDLRPSVGVGVKIPFTSPSVFTTTYTTAEATKTNLINFLLTNPGERYLNPTFGAGINGLLFQQSTDPLEDLLRIRVQSGIAQYFPQLQLNNFQVVSDRDRNTISILLGYSIINTNIQDQVVVNIET